MPGYLGWTAAPRLRTDDREAGGRAGRSPGRHLKILLDARLVLRRRAGRSVLYYRTAAGDTLLEAQQGG